MDRIFDALEEKSFVPAELVRTFGIGTSDYTASTLLAPLIAAMREEAPLVNFRLFPLGRLDLVRCLDEGRVDFGLSWFGEVSARFRRTPVWIEEET